MATRANAGAVLTVLLGVLTSRPASTSPIAFGSFLASNVPLRSDFVTYVALLFFIGVGVAVTQLRRSDP